MTRVEAVVFDLDGTLVDTLDDIVAALDHVLLAHRLPTHSRDEVRFLIGGGASALVRGSLPASEQVRTDVYLAEFRQRYASHLVDHSRPYPGIIPLLHDLAERRVPVAVLSNKPDDLTRQVVEQLLGALTFRAVRGQRDGVPRKPDPTAALALAEAMDIPPHRCAFVGDSGVDMDTARAAGMLPVGVLWGFRGRDELLEHGAGVLLDRPADLMPVLEAP